MKKQVLYLLLCGVLCISNTPAQPGCNYISSGYYQLIYEADIAYLSGDRELAYQKVSQAEKLCPLIQQPMYYEISNYIELLSERNYFEKAIQYITLLVSDYGYLPEWFEKRDYFPALSAYTDWNSLKQQLTNASNEFYSKVDTLLVKELKTITKNDQVVRKKKENQTEEDFIQQQATDAVHEARIKEIFETHGYPGQRLIGYKNTLWWSGIDALLMHFSDTTYFPPALLNFIEKGECSPDILGSFVDSRCRMKTNKDRFIYGIYSNIGDEEIWDVANLDKRRQAIGMSTKRMKQQRDSLIAIKYRNE
ncbi:MAG: hypothetical protein LBF81_04250 [Prevotellaceae bacterium]|jgi:hypothetical protein|nr:hypothetical protein [Prevotellaceae bacterium]